MLTVGATFYVGRFEESMKLVIDKDELDIVTYGDLLEYIFNDIWIGQGPLKRCYDFCADYYIVGHKFEERISDRVSYCEAVFTIDRN